MEGDNDIVHEDPGTQPMANDVQTLVDAQIAQEETRAGNIRDEHDNKAREGGAALAKSKKKTCWKFASRGEKRRPRTRRAYLQEHANRSAPARKRTYTVLGKIGHLQNEKGRGLLIPKIASIRLVREIATRISDIPDIRFESASLAALQESAENMLVQLFQLSQVAANHAHRVTIMKNDADLVDLFRHAFTSIKYGKDTKSI